MKKTSATPTKREEWIINQAARMIAFAGDEGQARLFRQLMAKMYQGELGNVG